MWELGLGHLPQHQYLILAADVPRSRFSYVRAWYQFCPLVDVCQLHRTYRRAPASDDHRRCLVGGMQQ